jgi:bifunctional DNA-binding transcriptional regulator/antitoxin component of YhaV-PrlF toxin-antitoxin module
MSKVTSNLQVSLPKALAEQFKITPGDEIEWVARGEFIKVLPSGGTAPAANPRTRLKLFDQVTVRQKQRQRGRAVTAKTAGRSWTREDLYRDGRGSH